jgi:hypothetical protein
LVTPSSLVALSPTGIVVVAGDGVVTVSFTPTATVVGGAEAPLYYIVTAVATNDSTDEIDGNDNENVNDNTNVIDGNINGNSSVVSGAVARGTKSPVVVTSLQNGKKYAFVVVGVNAAGASAPSMKSGIVTPRGLPLQPAPVSAVGANTDATVTFGSPSSQGSPIVSYT